MNGFLGVTIQSIVDKQIVNNALALRYVPKGESGHTIARIREEIDAELGELAALVADKTNVKFLLFFPL